MRYSVITLRYFLPGQTCTYFRTCFCVVGPLEAIHGPSTSSILQTSEFAVYDSLEQSPGIYGENNVDHTQYQGSASQVIEVQSLLNAAPIVGLDGFVTYPSYDTTGNLTGCTYYGLETTTETIRECRLILKFKDGYPNELYYYDYIEWNLERMYLVNYTQYFAPSSGTTYDYLRDSPVYYPDRLIPFSMADLKAMVTWFQRVRSGGYLYKEGIYTTPSIDIPGIVKKLTNSILVWSDKVVSSAPPKRDMGELAYQAFVNGHQVQTNVIAFLLDMRNIAELAPKLKNLRNIKGLSSQYLSVQYGILPTVSDIEEVFAAIRNYAAGALPGNRDELNLRLYQSGYTDSFQGRENSSRVITSRIKIAVKDNDDNIFYNLIHKLDDIGLLPDLKNIWDLVPYSFVLDWFIDVGDLLDRVDSRLQLSTMDVRYVTMSYKTTDKQSLKPTIGLPFNIDYTKRHYHRWVSDQCPTPPLSPTATQDFNHWVEASSLILQRK